MKNYILWYFMPLRRTVEVFSENPIIKKGTTLTKEERKEILNLYRVAKDILPNINYVYSGYEDKTLLINNYKPPLKSRIFSLRFYLPLPLLLNYSIEESLFKSLREKNLGQKDTNLMHL